MYGGLSACPWARGWQQSKGLWTPCCQAAVPKSPRPTCALVLYIQHSLPMLVGVWFSESWYRKEMWEAGGLYSRYLLRQNDSQEWVPAVLGGVHTAAVFVKFCPLPGWAAWDLCRAGFSLEFGILGASYAETTKLDTYRWMLGIIFHFIVIVLNAATVETNVLCNNLVESQEQHLHLHSVN